MKLNFSMLKDENIGFRYTKNNKTYSFCDKLLNVKQLKDHYEFIYENNHMVVNTNDFSRLGFIKEDDRYYFIIKEPNTMNGLIGFTMFDTYGFPLELTQEIIEEKGCVLDINGFELIKDISIKKSQKNSKKNNAF